MPLSSYRSFFMNARNAIIRFVLGWRRPSKSANLALLQERGETLSSFIIRVATMEDVPKIAHLHVRTWNETYYTKKSPTYYIREYQWRQQFENADGSWFVLVVEKPGGELIGFAKGMRYAHNDLPDYAGELNKIYLLRSYQRLGLGKRLMTHVARCFIDMGIYNMVLFGIPQNPSCHFYEAMGGQRLYAKNGAFHGGYGFPDLQQLASLSPGEKVYQ
jgi:GNAT superfamily N-acetyltransferase